jgi:hypothetical protein
VVYDLVAMTAPSSEPELGQLLARLRTAASALLADGTDPGSAQKAGEILKLASEIERQGAESSKLGMEEEKLRIDAEQSAGLRRSDNHKFYVSLLTPLLSTVVLAGTLALQTFQFTQSERAKRSDAQRQADALEDARWSEAVKALSASDRLSAAATLLKTYFASPRYGTIARQTAFGLLVQPNSGEVFRDLFLAAYSPITWDDLPTVLELDQLLVSQFAPLFATASKHKLTRDEQARYDELYADVSLIGNQIAPLLRSKRPPGVQLDLRNVDLWSCDLSNADLSGANIDGLTLTTVVLKGADLSGVSYRNLYWKGTAWWQSARMSPELVSYLSRTAPYDPHTDYGPAIVSQKDYDAGTATLSAPTGHN